MSVPSYIVQLFNHVSRKRGFQNSSYISSNSSSNGSFAHSILLITEDARVVLNKVVTIRGLETEYCTASFSILFPLLLQKFQAAFLHRVFNGSGAGCQSGAPSLVSNPIEKGDCIDSRRYRVVQRNPDKSTNESSIQGEWQNDSTVSTGYQAEHAQSHRQNGAVVRLVIPTCFTIPLSRNFNQKLEASLTYKIQIGKLNIMDIDQINIIHIQPFHAFVDAFHSSSCRVIPNSYYRLLPYRPTFVER